MCVGHERVHGHDVARVRVGRVLVHFDLRVEGALADADNQRTGPYDLLGHASGVVVQLVRGDGGVDQAPVRGGSRIDALAGQQQLQRAFAPDCATHRHHGCGAEQTDLHAGRAE